MGQVIMGRLGEGLVHDLFVRRRQLEGDLIFLNKKIYFLFLS